MDLESAKSIVVIKPSSLGDIVHTLPAVNLIAEKYPDLDIHWIAATPWVPLLREHPALESVIDFPRDAFRGLGGAMRFPGWARGLRRSMPNLDAALDFQGLLRSALMAWGCGASHRVGLSDAREGARFFYDEVVDCNPRGHAVDRYLEVVRAAGMAVGTATLEYRLPEGERPAALTDEVAGEPFVLLHPFSRGDGKSLTSDQIERFCRAMAPHRVVIAGRTDSPASEAPSTAAADLTNRTSVLELLWLLRRAAFVVSVDSGPMHLGAAVTDRVLGIHTWTDPRRVGPHGDNCHVWKAGAIRRVGDLEPSDGKLAEDRSAKVSTLDDVSIDQMAAFVGGELEGNAPSFP